MKYNDGSEVKPGDFVQIHTGKNGLIDCRIGEVIYKNTPEAKELNIKKSGFFVIHDDNGNSVFWHYADHDIRFVKRKDD